jgi:hypothetical protein
MESMPSVVRLARAAASPATRGLVAAALRSPTARDLARRAVSDPRGLGRHLTDPATLRDLGANALAHPSVSGFREFVLDPDELPRSLRLVRGGLLFLPLRYVPVGYVGLWAARRLLRSEATGRPRGSPASPGRPRTGR